MTAAGPPTASARVEDRASCAPEFDPLELAADELGLRLDVDEIEAAAPSRPYHNLHLWYTAVVFVLIATGLLIEFPDLRARLTGGYGTSIAAVHEWVGVAMLVLPVLALTASPGQAVETVRLRSGRRDALRFHAFNLWFTLISGAVFIGSGLILWFPASISVAVLDVSAEIHRAFAYALYAVVPLHLVFSRARIVASVRGWWSRPHWHASSGRSRVTTEDPPSC